MSAEQKPAPIRTDTQKVNSYNEFIRRFYPDKDKIEGDRLQKQSEDRLGIRSLNLR